MELLKQGLSPEKLALSLAFGAALGVFPIVGLSSTLCILMAFVFKLNHVAIQIANYLVYPLQFLLIVPHVRFGEWVLGLPETPFSPEKVVGTLSDDFMQGLQIYGTSLLVACLGWFLQSVPSVLILRMLLKPVLLRKFEAKPPK